MWNSRECWSLDRPVVSSLPPSVPPLQRSAFHRSAVSSLTSPATSKKWKSLQGSHFGGHRPTCCLRAPRGGWFLFPVSGVCQLVRTGQCPRVLLACRPASRGGGEGEVWRAEVRDTVGTLPLYYWRVCPCTSEIYPFGDQGHRLGPEPFPLSRGVMG